MSESETTPIYPPGTLQEFFDDGRSKWGRHADATTKAGMVVDIESPNAVRFCMVGAVRKVYRESSPKKMDEVLGKLLDYTRGLGFDCITTWNDSYASFSEVKRVVKELGI